MRIAVFTHDGSYGLMNVGNGHFSFTKAQKKLQTGKSPAFQWGKTTVYF
jgi:hypothetical protein